MVQHQDALRQINKSGFPFQLRVEHQIRITTDEHNWLVASREHPWTNGDNGAGFIDIVLRHRQSPTFRLVMECKRIKADDARQLRWVFLLPEHESEPTMLASCFEVERSGRKDQTGGSTWNDIRVWDNVSLEPSSLQSEFCILQSDEQRKQPILEGLAAELLASIEGLAQEEVSIVESRNNEDVRARLFIFPAIVTNAEIAVCSYEPSKIEIIDGTLKGEDLEIKTVPFIRFRKSLATTFPKGSFYDLEATNRARERSVFVVNATSLTEFLKDWNMRPLPDGDYATRSLLR